MAQLTAAIALAVLLSVSWTASGADTTYATPNYKVKAAYSPAFKCPICAGRSVTCNTHSLLQGRAGLREGTQELTPPNTIDGCPDGQEGRYTVDETVESITVTSIDGAVLTVGSPVKVAIEAYCYGSDDKVALYWAPLVFPGQAPAWQQIGLQSCSSDESVLQSTEVFTFNFTHTLGMGYRQAYRAQMVLSQSKDLKPCVPGPYNDHDDLVIDVQEKTAFYSSQYKAPFCQGPFTACNSGFLLLGRGAVPGGAERNGPNTLDGCADGDVGVYTVDPSIEYVNIRSTTGDNVVADGAVIVEIKAQCKSSTNRIVLLHAADAAKPDWKQIAVQDCGSTTDVVTYEFAYKLPTSTSSVHAVRAILDATTNGSGSCRPGLFNDSDDLVFSLAA